MKIGVVGPIWHNIPPQTYGGTEEVVCNLVNGLVARKHEVTLFGPKTAVVMANIHPTVRFPLRESGADWTNVGYSLLHITKSFDMVRGFDLLHVHLNKIQDYFALPLAIFSKTPVLFTLHFKIPDSRHKDKYDRYLVLKKYAALPFTSISDSQRGDSKLTFIQTVYNGVDIKRFPFSDKKGDYLVWLGKVSQFKGTKDALTAAQKTQLKIYLMGTIERDVPELFDYYQKEIKPFIDGRQIVWLGEVSHNEKASILSGAKALLNPIQWEEPFGLVMAESQACGTPVISYKRGAASEIILHGKTGFLVDSLDEMVEKIPEVERLDRRACRQHIEENFTIEKMVRGYEEAYRFTIEHWEDVRDRQKKKLDR